MKIIRAGFGNSEEAFIEENFSDKVNIIYSNENNKGKTLLIQGILYSIGNEAIFPSGFMSDKYYFFLEVMIKNKIYKFLRKRNTIITISENLYRVCSSISEFKHFVNEKIFDFPSIIKNERRIMVDPMLYYQLFFIGQDKRNSSNIFNNGYYNKKDFFNMLCSLNGFPLEDVENNEKEIEKKILECRIEIKKLKKTMKFYKENPKIASFTNSGINRDEFVKVKEDLSNIIINISEYSKQRKSAYIRKTNLENLLGELRSINHNVKKGTVCCLNCGSKNISYTNGDISFDISNTLVRSEIMNSIKQQIEAEQVLIDEAEANLGLWQEKLNKEVNIKKQFLNDILLYSEDIISSKDCGEKISSLMDEIKKLEKSKEEIKIKNDNAIEESKNMKSEILKIMNAKIREIDPYSRIKFEDLFTKSGENYSGSEEQEFYFCKIIALEKYFNFDFPIIVDSFRDGELSSTKEKIMLETYKNIGKQVILTSTLKKEEYDLMKYHEISGINAIDYSKHIDNKILQERYVGKFIEILNLFNVIL